MIIWKLEIKMYMYKRVIFYLHLHVHCIYLYYGPLILKVLRIMDLNLKRFLAYYGKIILMPEILMGVYHCSTAVATRTYHSTPFWNHSLILDST
jgi:hypothetical protein